MTNYVGTELELFANASNWKSYWKSRIKGFVKGDVLDVGAGAGATRACFEDDEFLTWHAVEPDEHYAELIQFPKTRVTAGTLRDVTGTFDTILYIDVLEHIEDDRTELKSALDLLRPNGHLIVLSPSHNALYSPFDKAIGHYRRYNKAMLRALTPDHWAAPYLEYLDSVGMLLSLGNRWVLRSEQPTTAQIQTWDRLIVPVSRLMDPLTGRNLGKSIIAVWKK